MYLKYVFQMQVFEMQSKTVYFIINIVIWELTA